MFRKRRLFKGLALHERGRDAAGVRVGLAVIAGGAVVAAWAWPAAAAARQAIEEPATQQVSEQPSADRVLTDEEWLEEGSGEVEQRDLQADGPTFGPGVRISMPAWSNVEWGESAPDVGGIPIPSTARMPGEVRYIEVPVPVIIEDDDRNIFIDDPDYFDDDEPFAIRGIVTELHGPDRHRRHRGHDHGRRRASDQISGGLTPADPVFRRAQLRFSEATTAGNAGLRRSEDVFRRAQFRFHDASTRPHVGEGSGARRDADRPERPRRDGDRGRRGGERRRD